MNYVRERPIQQEGETEKENRNDFPVSRVNVCKCANKSNTFERTIWAPELNKFCFRSSHTVLCAGILEKQHYSIRRCIRSVRSFVPEPTSASTRMSVVVKHSTTTDWLTKLTNANSASASNKCCGCYSSGRREAKINRYQYESIANSFGVDQENTFLYCNKRSSAHEQYIDFDF